MKTRIKKSHSKLEKRLSLRIPSFLSGISRVLDLGCTSGPSHYNYKKSVSSASEALRSDWAILGQDIKISLNILDSRIRKK